MDIIQEFRRKKHEEYLRSQNKKSEEERKIKEKQEAMIIFQRRKDLLKTMYLKYKNVLVKRPSRSRSINIAKRIIKERFFRPVDNPEEMLKIPSMQRMRITFTGQHLCEYFEMDDDNIEQQRLEHNFIYGEMSNLKLFTHCFDINLLYPNRNDPIIIESEIYYLQPNDHVRLIKLWKRINGNTDESLSYLQQFQYQKSIFDSYQSRIYYAEIEKDNQEAISNIDLLCLKYSPE